METQEREYSGLKISGFLIVFILLLFSALSIVLTINDLINSHILKIVSFIIVVFFLKGFMLVEPNMAVVFVFFGKYKGTFRLNGFYWINPFYKKHYIPLRMRNKSINPIKVNDKNGNPIEIGTIIVWKIKDTYKASFEIDNSTENIMQTIDNFTDLQSDAALRQVASVYAYDDQTETITLRSNGDEVGDRLEQELNNRLAIAGIEVVEARINYLAYAPEIARVMLRRQQAEAIIAAREKIVEGAVSMVELALKKLQEENIVTLNDHRRAVMVSNLLAVLCADEGVHQA